MILRSEYSPYVALNKYVSDEKLNVHVTPVQDIVLRDALGKDLWQSTIDTYYLSKSCTIAGQIVTVDNTTVLEGTDYAYLTGTNVAKRVKFSIIDATTIELEESEVITSGNLTYFINYELFKVLRPFFVLAVWLRYANAGMIESTESGLKQNTNQFSEFVSDGTIARYLATYRNDFNFYKQELLDYINTQNACVNQGRIKKMYPIKIKNEYSSL